MFWICFYKFWSQTRRSGTNNNNRLKPHFTLRQRKDCQGRGIKGFRWIFPFDGIWGAEALKWRGERGWDKHSGMTRGKPLQRRTSYITALKICSSVSFHYFSTFFLFESVFSVIPSYPLSHISEPSADSHQIKASSERIDPINVCIGTYSTG